MKEGGRSPEEGTWELWFPPLGNAENHPLFENAVCLTSRETVHGDYHLTQNSPFIDAGDPNYPTDPNATTQDIDGNPRVVGIRVDIGAHEFQAECDGDDFDADETPDNCDRDIDGDGIWNVPDQCDYTAQGVPVGADGRPLADLDHDRDVDLNDHALMQRSFGGPE